MRHFIMSLLLLLCLLQAMATVRLPRIFSDHMVLQREKPLPVWGWADAGERVTVTFAGHQCRGITDRYSVPR